MQWKQEMQIYFGAWLGIELSAIGLFFNQSILIGAGLVMVAMPLALRSSQSRTVAPVSPLTPPPDSNEADFRLLLGASTPAWIVKPFQPQPLLPALERLPG